MRALTSALGVVGFAVAASSAAAELGDRGPAIIAYSTTSPGLAIVSSLAGASLFASAVLLVAEAAQSRLALATCFLGVVWSADLWAGWSGAPVLLRNVGMLLVPMLAPAALLVAVAATSTRTAAIRVAAIGIFLAAIASAVVVWLVRDPFLDRYCWRDCSVHSLAPFSDPELARTMTNVSLSLDALCGVAVAMLCAIHAFRRPGRWMSLVGVVTGCALVASDAALRVEPSGKPGQSLFSLLFVARGLALVALGVALGHLALHARLVRRAISRLALAGDGLACALAGALGMSALRIGYPLADGSLIVDPAGRPIAIEGAPAMIVRGGEVIALVDAAGGAPDSTALTAALGPAARLALANERLQANQLFRLHELAGLRRRIVATGDATRRRLEHDLHDGAQQRLLTLAIDLRVAIRQAEAATRPDIVALLLAAAARTAEATDELRSVAHGIFPATLTTSGLAAALESLADTRPILLSIDLEPGRRYPTEVEAAAYAVVFDATAGAREPARVGIEERQAELVLTIDVAESSRSSSAEERVGAAGGTITRIDRTLQAILPLPPASALCGARPDDT